MSNRVVYEVSLRIDDANTVELGAWLPGHIDEMLALPGFIEAKYFDPVRDGDGGHWIHTVQYTLANRDALDNYLANDAERMRRPGAERFGDALQASRSIREVVNDGNEAARCLNCGVALAGQYCWNCGQRGNTRLISLFELLRDAFGDMFELDSRLWRTLIPLALRPGVLTDEYLRGRRARYMPPFRMYLVLSFIFFLLANMIGDGVAVDIDGADVAGEVRQGLADGVADGDAEALAARLEEAGVDADAAAETARQAVTAGEEARRAIEAAGDDGFYCNIGLGDTGIDWLDRTFDEERSNRICEEIRRDNGRRFLERWGENTPVAALAVLPLMALLLKAMYPLSRRYYVEHLLMLVHFHSFLFLLLSLGLGFNGLAEFAGLPEALIVAVNVAGWVYVPVYLYRSIRTVYRQGRVASLFKFLVMLTGYLAATVVVVVLTLLYVVATY